MSARKRRIIAANRAAAKEKAETNKSGPKPEIDTVAVFKQAKKEKQLGIAPTVTLEPPKKVWTGKAPIDLLHEHLQKQKWDRANWHCYSERQDTQGKSTFAWRVDISHPKTKETLQFKTIIFRGVPDPTDQTEQVGRSHRANGRLIF